MALGVGEIEPGDGRAGPHGEALGQLDAGLVINVHQLPQRPLLGVVGLGRIAGRGADAAILLENEIVVREALVARIAPQLAAHLGMEGFRKGFREPVRERLGDDAVVIVGHLDVGPDRLLLAEARGDGKAAHVVGEPGLHRRHEIGECGMGAVASGIAGDLLAQREKLPAFVLARLVGEEHNVVADAVGRPEADDGIRRVPLLGDDAVEQSAGVGKELLRLAADLVVVEDRGIAAGELPRLEERRPIDEGHEIGERERLERARPEEGRLRRYVAGPVDGILVGTRGRERDALLLGFVGEMRLAHLHVFGLDAVDVGFRFRFREQVRDHAHGTARVQHVDGLAAVVVRADLDRGVHAAGRGAADQQRHGETFPLHLGGNEAHLVQ